MGLLRRVVTLPLAPVEGLVWLAERLEEQAYQQLYGPEAVRRRLDELDEAFARGEISEDDRTAAEETLLESLGGRGPGTVLDGR